jgi:glucose-6-phosphate dehydrogenase assembly protein OpcA
MSATNAGPPEQWTLAGSRGGPLDVARLERDLASMWKTATARTGGTAVSRACASTLAVVSGEPGAADAERWVQAISRRHPCRVIQIELRPGPGGLEASAGAVCHLRPGSEGLICVEVIRVIAGGGSADLLPSVVRSLAIGGLPLVLLAADAAAREAPACARMAADADLTVVDSRRAADLARGDAHAVRDLAWSRTAAMRRALACGAERHDVAGVLASLREVWVAHGGPAEPSPPAVLFAGWLAAGLGLEPDGRADGAVALRREGAACRLRFEGRPGGDDGPGALRLIGTVGEVDVLLEPACARVMCAAGRRTVALRPADPAGSVIREVHRHEPDPAYLRSLSPAREMLRALEGS